jgi:hypothetical protein
MEVLGLLTTAGTIATTITLTIKTLSDLRGQYKDADLRIRLLIGELSTVKSKSMTGLTISMTTTDK